jgi:hypothetical protein
MFILSLTKLKIRAKQYLLGSKGVGARKRGQEGGGSYDPIIVCTYE